MANPSAPDNAVTEHVNASIEVNDMTEVTQNRLLDIKHWIDRYEREDLPAATQRLEDAKLDNDEVEMQLAANMRDAINVVLKSLYNERRILLRGHIKIVIDDEKTP